MRPEDARRGNRNVAGSNCGIGGPPVRPEDVIEDHCKPCMAGMALQGRRRRTTRPHSLALHRRAACVAR